MTRACLRRDRNKDQRIKKAVPSQSAMLPPKAETLPRADSRTDAARRSGAAPNAQDLKTMGRESASPGLNSPRRAARPRKKVVVAAAFVRPRSPRSSRTLGAPGQPRGAPLVAPARRSFTFRFLPSSAWARLLLCEAWYRW